MRGSSKQAKESELTEVLDLAEKRFMQWHQKKEAERAEETRAIPAENLSALGRAARRASSSRSNDWLKTQGNAAGCIGMLPSRITARRCFPKARWTP